MAKKKKIEVCDICEANDKLIEAVWKYPSKYGEKLCDKCYQDMLQSYKNYKRIKK